MITTRRRNGKNLEKGRIWILKGKRSMEVTTRKMRWKAFWTMKIPAKE